MEQGQKAVVKLEKEIRKYEEKTAKTAKVVANQAVKVQVL